MKSPTIFVQTDSASPSPHRHLEFININPLGLSTLGTSGDLLVEQRTTFSLWVKEPRLEISWVLVCAVFTSASRGSSFRTTTTFTLIRNWFKMAMNGLFIRAETGSPPFVVFDALQFSALVLLVAMLLPALLARSVQRMKTWFNLIVACIVYCISFLLLLGRQSGPEPPFALCLFQAGLIYAAPATVSAAGFAFVIELYLRLSSTLAVTEVKGRRITILLFVSPITHLIVFWVAIFTGLSVPLGQDGSPIVERNAGGLYCHVNSELPTTFTGVTVILFIALMILMEVYTVVYLVRRRSGFRGMRLPSGVFPLSLFIRTASYTLAGGLGIILVDILMNSVAASSNSPFVVLDLMAIIPLSVALVFGSQMDILGVYMFWKKKRYQNPDQNGKV
ncbi:hypothetical protein B0H11DRAFT_2003422 [Mycena galericulata]|nr:hypothetical protein B0H11DRAFT_2003422 [Mycena galericulata]